MTTGHRDALLTHKLQKIQAARLGHMEGPNSHMTIRTIQLLVNWHSLLPKIDELRAICSACIRPKADLSLK